MFSIWASHFYMSIKVALIVGENDLLCTQHRINMEAQLIQLTCTSSGFSTFALMFRSKGRNKGRYVTLSFYHFISQTSVNSVSRKADCDGISLCSPSLELKISSKHATWILPRLYLLVLLLFSDFLLFPALCPHLKRWSDLAVGNEISRAKHDLCLLSVLLCLSVCLVTFLPYAQTGADTRVRMYTACSFVTHQHTLLRMKTA